MRSVNVSLTSTTWELAKNKPNFSAWVRAKLLEEVTRNKEQWDQEWNKPHVEYEVKNVEVKE